MFNQTTRSVWPIFLLVGNRVLRIRLVLICLALASAGCGSTDARLWVDNAGSKAIVVSVDGKEEATIEPDQFKMFKCEPGERRIRIQCGDKLLFDGTKDLQKSGSYMFNPDNRNRYVAFAVKYGSSPFEGMIDQVVKTADRPQQIKYAYQKALKEVTLLPSSPWFEINMAAYVLTSPPEFVTTRGMTERRTVLTRVDPKDYAFLEAAGKKTNPSENDLKALTEVVERVLDSDL